MKTRIYAAPVVKGFKTFYNHVYSHEMTDDTTKGIIVIFSTFRNSSPGIPINRITEHQNKKVLIYVTNHVFFKFMFKCYITPSYFHFFIAVIIVKIASFSCIKT